MYQNKCMIQIFVTDNVIDFVVRANKKNHPQTLFEECKYVRKE